MQYDRKLKISIAQSRKSINWITEEITWSNFTKKLENPIRTQETYEQFMKLKKSQQDDLKDVGRICGWRIKR